MANAFLMRLKILLPKLTAVAKPLISLKLKQLPPIIPAAAVWHNCRWTVISMLFVLLCYQIWVKTVP